MYGRCFAFPDGERGLGLGMFSPVIGMAVVVPVSSVLTAGPGRRGGPMRPAPSPDETVSGLLPSAMLTMRHVAPRRKRAAT